ncbi:unnamed protein product, partial [Tetraodon nigroviridis]
IRAERRGTREPLLGALRTGGTSQADGSVERQSGPGDRSLGGHRSGGSSGTGPARHEGGRLRQECRQNRGEELDLSAPESG